SALYHRGTWSPPWSVRLQRMDHLMIFFLIAGTATPVFLLAMPGPLGLTCLIVMWTLTGAAAVIHLCWMSAPEALGGATFIGLGSLAGLALPEVWINAGVVPGTLMLAGGLIYIAGALSYHRRRPDPSPAVFGYHEVFHACVCGAARWLTGSPGQMPCRVPFRPVRSVTTRAKSGASRPPGSENVFFGHSRPRWSTAGATGGRAMLKTRFRRGHNPDLWLVRRRPTGPAGDLLTWDVQVRGALAVVAVGGELDIDSAPGLERELAPVADAGRHLILDLAGLRFCDCAGLSLFLRVQQRARAAGGS